MKVKKQNLKCVKQRVCSSGLGDRYSRSKRLKNKNQKTKTRFFEARKPNHEKRDFYETVQKMRIGGLTKFSLIDYPGKISAVIFTQGCNFRCPYCHNPELVYPRNFTTPYPEKDALDFLRMRIKRLEGVVVTGGEPTLQPDLQDFLRQVKAMGFAVKLDTNGSTPFILQKLIDEKLIDYIAMDIKAPFEKYHRLTGVVFDTDIIRRSMALIMNAGIDYEFRTTQVDAFLNSQDMLTLDTMLKDAKRYTIQDYIPRTEKFLTELSDITPFAVN